MPILVNQWRPHDTVVHFLQILLHHLIRASFTLVDLTQDENTKKKLRPSVVRLYHLRISTPELLHPVSSFKWFQSRVRTESKGNLFPRPNRGRVRTVSGKITDMNCYSWKKYEERPVVTYDDPTWAHLTLTMWIVVNTVWYIPAVCHECSHSTFHSNHPFHE